MKKKLNEWQMLTLFAQIAGDHIKNLDVDGLNYDLLKYRIDESGPICGDSQLMEAFENNCELTSNKLYEIIESVCLDFVNNVGHAEYDRTLDKYIY